MHIFITLLSSSSNFNWWFGDRHTSDVSILHFKPKRFFHLPQTCPFPQTGSTTAKPGSLIIRRFEVGFFHAGHSGFMLNLGPASRLLSTAQPGKLWFKMESRYLRYIYQCITQFLVFNTHKYIWISIQVSLLVVQLVGFRYRLAIQDSALKVLAVCPAPAPLSWIRLHYKFTWVFNIHIFWPHLTLNS